MNAPAEVAELGSEQQPLIGGTDALSDAALPRWRSATPSATRNIAKILPRTHYPPFSDEEMDKVDDILRNIDVNELRDAINAHFLQMDQEARIIAVSMKAGMEIVLYGASGYGKSDLVRFIIQHLGLNDYTSFFDFGASTTEADLYGGLDIKKFKDESEMRYRTNESFMQFPVAVFEEALDGSNEKVLHSLRSLFTSGIFTKNGKDELVRTGLIFICTNRDPNEFANESDASGAFLSRFPVRCKIKWKSHESQDYFNLLSKRFPEVDEDSISFMSDVYAKVSTSNNRGPGGTTRVVSPKEAIQALELITNASEKPSELGEKIHITKDSLWVLLSMDYAFGSVDDCISVFRESEELKRFDDLHGLIDGSLTDLEAIDLSKFENLAVIAAGSREIGRIIDSVNEKLDNWTDNRKKDVDKFIKESGSRLKLLMQKVVEQPPTASASV